MILPDVNVLIYAFHADAKDHLQYRDWLRTVVNAGTAYGMTPQVLGSVARIVTNRKTFHPPYTVEEALSFGDALLNHPDCQVIRPGERHWRIFSDLCRESQATGKLVADAWLAAIAIESGCEWITIDRDYARFSGLRWRTPF